MNKETEIINELLIINSRLTYEKAALTVEMKGASSLLKDAEKQITELKEQLGGVLDGGNDEKE